MEQKDNTLAQPEENNEDSEYPDITIYEKYMKKKLNLCDSYDNEYTSIEDMWRQELDPVYVEMEKADPNSTVKVGRVGDKVNWYKVGTEYWDKQPATIDGVCGGYG